MQKSGPASEDLHEQPLAPAFTHDDRTEVHSGSDTEESSAGESTQNGSKKRKRPMKISCELCKARKVKCDREEPACGWCARNNRVCIYRERKKPGLRASYGVELEDKLNRIEATLHVLGRRVEDHITTTPCCHHGSGGQPVDVQRAESAPINSPIDGISHSIANSHASWHPQPTSNPTLGFSSRLADSLTGQPVTSAPSEHNQVPSTYGVSPKLDLDEFSQSSDDLPPSDLLYDLVDTYFKHVNTWSPILDRKATFEALFGSVQPLREPDRILLHAIIAVTLRFSRDPRLTTESRKKFHDVSKQKVQLYALETPSIRAMQALALLAVDVLGTSNGPAAWSLLALLARNIVQLGLGVERSVYLAPPVEYLSMKRSQAFTPAQPESWIEDEGRRRLFWLTYILDRYATIATTYDFILNETETDRPLPCRYDLFSKNEPVETRWFRTANSTDTILDISENLGSFSYHCEVLRILSQIHKFLRTPVDINSVAEVQSWRDTYRELDSKLNTWLSHLPGEYGKISQLCHSDPGSRVSNWIMIHAAFVTAVIRLHSVAAYPTSRSHIFMPSHNAVQTCLAAVESLNAIAHDVIDTAMLDLLGPPFAFSLWVSSRLLLVHAATVECPVDPKIWFLISTLETMGQYWDVARNWAGTLSRVVREGVQAGEEVRQGHSVPSGKTFTEMRKSAHDLTSLISRNPRSVLDPPSTRSTSLNDLEYMDVFEWFSYPRLPQSISHRFFSSSMLGSNNFGLGEGTATGVFATPNPESDWLNFKQPYGFKPPHE